MRILLTAAAAVLAAVALYLTLTLPPAAVDAAIFADEALASLEPGDVLVVPFTTPAYNAVLAVCGAVVTEEGGALAHAAVLARELGIPAVVGAEAAMATIEDGAEVTVDPVAGTVSLA